MAFPNGVVPTLERVHPTPLYDALSLVTLFLILWSIRKKDFKPGTIFGLFAMFLGVERFITEFWRTDPKYIFGLLSEAQMISIVLFLAGIGLIVYVNKIKKYK
jgi:phosphatidylglycerol:prolipoprotein diacylglycerol transferase